LEVGIPRLDVLILRGQHRPGEAGTEIEGVALHVDLDFGPGQRLTVGIHYEYSQVAFAMLLDALHGGCTPRCLRIASFVVEV
jgi:hypothetical protein